MPYIVRNISSGYKILLKHQVQPGGILDLEEVFEGFCKPKRSKRAQEAKYSEYTKDDFQEFLDKVENVYARNRGVWEFDFSGDEASDAERKKKKSAQKKKYAADHPQVAVTRKDKKRKAAMITRRNIRRAIDGDITPKEMAWLPFNEDTKNIISNCRKPQTLKLALKLARNISGQERVRDLIDRRLLELMTDGVA